MESPESHSSPTPALPPSDVCPHFGECGGCQTQDVPYEEQLARKETMLRKLLAPAWNSAIPVDPSPEIWHYRNKVDPNFGQKRYPEPPPKEFVRETVLGFKRKNQWFWTLDITDCRIGPKGLEALLGSVRDWAKAHNLPAFSSKTKEGFLRMLLVREGKHTGERMVVLITTEGELQRDSFVEAVQAVFPSVSIQWAVYRGAAEIAAADRIEVLHGKPTIEERLRVGDPPLTRELRFRLSPFSFFQTNTLATEHLYSAIRRWVRESRPQVLYDLYGGSGGIALSCHDCVDRVVSVELVESASVDGVFNRETNNVDNVVFLTETVEDYLREEQNHYGHLQSNSVVVLDPPRSGLHPKVLKRLLLLKPREIIYVSCKPEVFAGELNALRSQYELRDVYAFDLFPHTEHVELLARLAAK